MSWTKDNDISTTWNEDNLSTEWGYLFNQITESFDIITLKFNEISSGVTLTEDSYISTSWSED
jgi:hypothetical protein